MLRWITLLSWKGTNVPWGIVPTKPSQCWKESDKGDVWCDTAWSLCCPVWSKLLNRRFRSLFWTWFEINSWEVHLGSVSNKHLIVGSVMAASGSGSSSASDIFSLDIPVPVKFCYGLSESIVQICASSGLAWTWSCSHLANLRSECFSTHRAKSARAE